MNCLAAPRTVRRTAWTFNIPQKELAAAVAAKVELHTSKLNHWMQQYDEAKVEIRTHGIDFEREVSASRVTNSMHYSEELSIDPRMEREMQQRKEKMMFHKDMLEEFSRWARALARGTETDTYNPRVFELNIDDLEYFGL